MNLTLSWEQQAGRVIPSCSSAIVNQDGVSLLACLLMDDGGQGYLDTIPWLVEGIAKVDSVANGEVSEANWDRDDWGVTLRSDKATVYSLHDEAYTEVIELCTFRRALDAWLKFVQSTPSPNSKRDVKI